MPLTPHGSGLSAMSAVDLFEDGNANMPLDIASDEEGQPTGQARRRRRRLVFSGGLVSGSVSGRGAGNSPRSDGNVWSRP